MILFFSGTGNSQYVAKILAEKTKDDIISINKLVKQGNQKQLVSQGKPFVFVCPTYAWRIPIEMKEYKPNWQNNCTHCMACISDCPTLAIEYKNKTQGKPRYYLECK